MTEYTFRDWLVDIWRILPSPLPSYGIHTKNIETALDCIQSQGWEILGWRYSPAAESFHALHEDVDGELRVQSRKPKGGE
jgi:hypothetical protein